MKIKLDQAIAKARKGESLAGITIEELGDKQVKAKDALLLAEYGILIPEQNIYYDDSDIVYDPDIDDVEWSQDPVKMTWEEKVQLFEDQKAEKVPLSNKENELVVKVEIHDQEVRDWVKKNRDKMGLLLGGLITDLYKVRMITEE
jgi:hypothetical protein